MAKKCKIADQMKSLSRRCAASNARLVTLPFAQRAGARLSDSEYVESAAGTVVERGHTGFDFDGGVPDGFQAESKVRLGEDYAFDDAGLVADRDELHLVAGDLMV
jgi:hypothetical protein